MAFINIPPGHYVSGPLPFAEGEALEWNINPDIVRAWLKDSTEEVVLFLIESKEGPVITTFNFGPWMDALP